MVYVTASMVAMLAFASLAVDMGHVYVVRSELRLAADAAARYGVTGLESGISVAQSYAVNAADDNTSDGVPVVLDPATDIEFGLWEKESRKYTPLYGPARTAANAMKVTARRTAANGRGVSLLFARVLGKTTHDVEMSAIAYLEKRTASGIIGLDGITFKNNTFVASYNSATNKYPTPATSFSFGNLGSNGAIFGGANNLINGGIVLGPSAPNVVGINASGSTTRLSTPIVAPTEPAWNPAVNPDGIPQNYSASGSVTLPGGTYSFTSLMVNGSLTFSGPATLLVNGPIRITGSCYAYDVIPSNLKIYQLGRNDFGDYGINGMDLVADIVALDSDFLARNNLRFRGQMIFRSIKLQNNGDFYYDVALGGSTGGGPIVVTVR